jgi:hypothetical protein
MKFLNKIYIFEHESKPSALELPKSAANESSCPENPASKSL